MSNTLKINICIGPLGCLVDLPQQSFGQALLKRPRAPPPMLTLIKVMPGGWWFHEERQENTPANYEDSWLMLKKVGLLLTSSGFLFFFDNYINIVNAVMAIYQF